MWMNRRQGQVWQVTDRRLVKTHSGSSIRCWTREENICFSNFENQSRWPQFDPSKYDKWRTGALWKLTGTQYNNSRSSSSSHFRADEKMAPQMLLTHFWESESMTKSCPTTAALWKLTVAVAAAFSSSSIHSISSIYQQQQSLLRRRKKICSSNADDPFEFFWRLLCICVLLQRLKPGKYQTTNLAVFSSQDWSKYPQWGPHAL